MALRHTLLLRHSVYLNKLRRILSTRTSGHHARLILIRLITQVDFFFLRFCFGINYLVWSILETRACQQPHQSIESLKLALQREWDLLEEETIAKIIDDFPKRIDACIEAKGKHFE